MNTTFLRNVGNVLGGAVFLQKMGTKNRLDFTNCAFWWNHTTASGEAGGAMFLEGTTPTAAANAKIVNCTFALNWNIECDRGPALNVGTYAIGVIYNSIVWHNHDPVLFACQGTPPIAGNPTIEYSDIETGWTGAGSDNTFLDPNFVDLFQFDLSLQLGSDCIDHADYGRLPKDTLDVDGDGDANEDLPIDLAGSERFVDVDDVIAPDQGAPQGAAWLDMGAYEHPDP